MDKRMKKMEIIESELNGPARYGPEQAELTLIGWGSTQGSIRETVERLTGGGVSVNALHFSDIWPLPEKKVMDALSECVRTVIIENNYSGQFARLLRGSTGLAPDKKFLKYDGRPFSSDQIIDWLAREEEIDG